LIGLWEAFIVARQRGHPIYYLFFPRAPRSLVKPTERCVAEAGNVDLFRFWLNREIDPAPEKAAQYGRRRTLAGSSMGPRPSGNRP
jgi:hypothetical protein